MICQYGGGSLLDRLIQFPLRRLPPFIRLPSFGRGGQVSARFLLRRSVFMYCISLVFEVSKEVSDFWYATVCRLR